MRKHILVGMAVILVLAVATIAMAADPFVGTWKLNLAKSTFNLYPAPKSGGMTIAAQDNGIKLVGDTIEADGKPSHLERICKFDGKECRATGSPVGLTMLMTKVDTNSINVVLRLEGKEIGVGKMVVSKDGKMLTNTQKGKNAQGQDESNTIIWDKQ